MSTFSVPEQNLADIKKYPASGELQVEAIIPGDEKPVRGELTFIDNAVDRTTGTIKLKGDLREPGPRLWPGQFVDVILTLTTERDRVVVPSQAVQTGQQGQYVYVIKDDMTAELRVVTPGRTYETWTIIDKGVAAGEKVVTDGQLRLVPGRRWRSKPSSCGSTARGKYRGKRQIPNDKFQINSKFKWPMFEIVLDFDIWCLVLIGVFDACNIGDCVTYEYFRTLHTPSGHDHAGHALDPVPGHRRVPAPAGVRPAERGLSHDPGERERAGRFAPRPWPLRWPRRWRSSSRPSRASIP